MIDARYFCSDCGREMHTDVAPTTNKAEYSDDLETKVRSAEGWALERGEHFLKALRCPRCSREHAKEENA